jgi:hypothetical protein
MRVVALRPESGEHRQLACSRRQLADDNIVFGKLPNTAGWQPALPDTAAATAGPIEEQSPVTRDFS